MMRTSLIQRLKCWFNEPGLRLAKRAIVFIIGFSVVLVGVAMIILPGPAIVVIPLGLLILSSEFAWARHWLHHARKLLGRDKTDDSNSSTK